MIDSRSDNTAVPKRDLGHTVLRETERGMTLTLFRYLKLLQINQCQTFPKHLETK